MKNTWIRPMHSAAIAAALVFAGAAAHAAPPPPPKPVPPPHHHHRGGPNGEPANADRLATHVGNPDDYARNALARCAVFKSEEDHHACVERVRKPVAEGSVSEGGVLREYSYTVPAGK